MTETVFVITSEFFRFRRRSPELFDAFVTRALSGLIGNRSRVITPSPAVQEWCRRNNVPCSAPQTTSVEALDVSRALGLWDGRSFNVPLYASRFYRRSVPWQLFLAGDLTMWNMAGRAEAVCVLTDGFVRRDRKGVPRAVCCRGSVHQVRAFLPDVDERLGRLILENGNVPQVVGNAGDFGFDIVSFPVNPAYRRIKDVHEVLPHARSRFRAGDEVPGFLLRPDVDTIRASAKALARLIKKGYWRRVFIPWPDIDHEGFIEAFGDLAELPVWMVGDSRAGRLKIYL